MSDRVRIAALFDVSLGYGSPQIGMLLQSLAQHYGPSHCVALEPDQKGRALSPVPIEEITAHRFGTLFPPYDEVFQIEYNRQLAAFLENFEPHVVIVPSAWTLPALLLQPRRPPLTIYYMLESLSHQVLGGGAYALDLNSMARDHIDLVLTPERRRAELDLRMLGWKSKPTQEVLNAGLRSTVRTNVERSTDELRFVHAGTIGASTLCDLLMAPEMSAVPFDVWGPCDTPEAGELVEKMGRQGGSVRYRGFIGVRELAERRRDYAFSLVAWRPDNINQILACPNKFFETIAAGVPPLCAPHPQCVEIVERYQCGLIMKDWSVEALRAAVDEAHALFASPRYEEMVGNCLRAARDELNWERQFESVVPLLPTRSALLL